MASWKGKLTLVKQKFDLVFDLKEDQLAIISEILTKMNVFAHHHTGYGKSLIFTLIPLVLDEFEVCIF